MLKQRIITALVLLGLLIPALFHPDTTWIAIAGLVLIGAAAWEWGRLNSLSRYQALWMTAACAGFCIGVWQLNLFEYFQRTFWLLWSAFWILMGAYLLSGGVSRWAQSPVFVRLLFGAATLCSTWLALITSKNLGLDFLMSVLLLVWMADIAAYFSGRAWGKRKLAPSISPGKTWEGVAGGIVGVFLLALVWLQSAKYFALSSHSLFDRLYAHSPFIFAVSLLLLVTMSIVGDLLESMVKRNAGSKDSSNLLPGHGGVLDRIDALLPTLPLAVMLALV